MCVNLCSKYSSCVNVLCVPFSTIRLQNSKQVRLTFCILLCAAGALHRLQFHTAASASQLPTCLGMQEVLDLCAHMVWCHDCLLSPQTFRLLSRHRLMPKRRSTLISHPRHECVCLLSSLKLLQNGRRHRRRSAFGLCAQAFAAVGMLHEFCLCSSYVLPCAVAIDSAWCADCAVHMLGMQKALVLKAPCLHSCVDTKQYQWSADCMYAWDCRLWNARQGSRWAAP